jgi:hypothetical protein
MKIKSESSAWAGITTLVGLIVISFMGIYVYLMQQSGKATWVVYAFTAPFFLAGIGIGYWGVRGLIRLARYGDWYLEATRPGVLGETMDVRLFPGSDVAPVGEIECHLCCIRSDSIDTGKSRSMKITTLWESTWMVTSDTLLKNVGLSLSLPFPEKDAAAFDQSEAFGRKPEWKLTVRVPLAGRSDAPIFEIPVRSAM